MEGQRPEEKIAQGAASFQRASPGWCGRIIQREPTTKLGPWFPRGALPKHRWLAKRSARRSSSAIARRRDGFAPNSPAAQTQGSLAQARSTLGWLLVAPLVLMSFRRSRVSLEGWMRSVITRLELWQHRTQGDSSARAIEHPA